MNFRQQLQEAYQAGYRSGLSEEPTNPAGPGGSNPPQPPPPGGPIMPPQAHPIQDRPYTQPAFPLDFLQDLLYGSGYANRRRAITDASKQAVRQGVFKLRQRENELANQRRQPYQPPGPVG